MKNIFISKRVIYIVLGMLTTFLTSQFGFATEPDAMNRARIKPTLTEIKSGSEQQFYIVKEPGRLTSAYATNMVSWFVNGYPGGNEKFGTITVDGLYLAPQEVPETSEIHICAEVENASNRYLWATVLLNGKKPSYKTVNEWGEAVGHSKYLNDPKAIDIERNGNILIADGDLLRFSPDGKFMNKLGYVKLGVEAHMAGLMNVKVDAYGHIFISDSQTGKPRIQVYSQNGVYLYGFGQKGAGPGRVMDTHGMAFDTEQRFYIGDIDNMRVNVYEHSGNFIHSIGKKGARTGEFNVPHGLVLDANNDLFVVSYFGPCQKLTSDGPAKSSRVFLIYYNNEDALSKTYQSDLQMQGEAPGLQIDNNLISVVLHPKSGHLDQLSLKKRPDFPLFHRMETNGAIHWNPEIYTPPTPWTHTSDWDPPQNVKSLSGPIFALSEMWGNLREIPQVDVSLRYKFYPGKPYFISSTALRINETVHCLALRNGGIVIKRELITNAAWYDVLRDSIINYDVTGMPDLTDLKMEADVPWISFYNKETGVGFAGIQLEYANVGLESSPRMLNPYFYITCGPWIYWARALLLSFHSSNMQQMIPAMQGNVFSEKWAYLIYEIDKGEKPYAPVLEWQKKLTNPLRVQLVEEVDERVSKTVTEIYIDKGKSGWEGRETGKHATNK